MYGTLAFLSLSAVIAQTWRAADEEATSHEARTRHALQDLRLCLPHRKTCHSPKICHWKAVMICVNRAIGKLAEFWPIQRCTRNLLGNILDTELLKFTAELRATADVLQII